MEHFVEFQDVCKYYQTGSVKIAAADHMNFYVDESVFVAENLVIVPLYIFHRFTDLATEISKADMKVFVLAQ